MTRAGFPYVKPQGQLVRADAWLLHDGTDFREAPMYLASWDYQTVLTLRREIEVDVQAARDASGLSLESQLGIAVSAFSTASWVRMEVFRTDLNPDDSRVAVQFALHGEEFGGNLRLRMALVLQHTDSTAPFIAHIPGSVLWEDTFEIRLQGDAPQFPISVVDFERAGFPPAAGWYLQVGSDLDAPLHASLRLYVNSTNSAVVAAFQNAGAPRPEDRAILRAVRADVARVMVEHALNQEDLRDERDWDPESLGFALRNLLRRFYRAEDLEQVSLRRLSHPADFSAQLFGQIRVFNDD